MSIIFPPPTFPAQSRHLGSAGWFRLAQLASVFNDMADVAVLITTTALLFVVSLLQQKYNHRHMIERQALWFRWIFHLAPLFTTIIFGVYGAGYNALDFLYMQF